MPTVITDVDLVLVLPEQALTPLTRMVQRSCPVRASTLHHAAPRGRSRADRPVACHLA